MTGGRNRKKFRQPFDDAKDDGKGGAPFVHKNVRVS
jgi:hypothetical protein